MVFCARNCIAIGHALASGTEWRKITLPS
jgi:hypothetical protein